jgi:DNA-binding CsgD family transcriptional regulator
MGDKPMSAPDDQALPPVGPAPGLQAIGLGPAEEAAYELLVDRPPTTLAYLAELAADRTGREELAEVLAALAGKGLVHRLTGPPVRYAAVAPEVALEALLAEQERRLGAARDHADRLVAVYYEHAHRHEADTAVEVVTGPQAVRQRLDQLRRSARREIRCLDKPPYFYQGGVPASEVELLSAGVSCRTIYDRAAVEADGLPEIEDLIRAGEQARVLTELPMKLYLIDDRCAVLPLRREPAAAQAMVVVHPSALLGALGDLFESLWQRALPLSLPSSPVAHRRGSSAATQQRLIALLLSGLTDQAIARQLGLGYRTVQRHIAALIEDLGVRTRFQAGVQVALRESATPHDDRPPLS